MWEDTDSTGLEQIKTSQEGTVLARRVKHTCGCTLTYPVYGSNYREYFLDTNASLVKASKKYKTMCIDCRKAVRKV